ncbi:MAG: hypothetical protein SV775_07560 [Thermodesulfobacteriota bacterium]|nr:hypothetical protein [Thermodesulfobacteriota bacterium]
MKALKRDLQSVIKSLKSLTQKTEKIAKLLDKLEKTKPVKPASKGMTKAAKKTAAKRGANVTAIDTVMDVIKRSKKGVNTATLSDKTGFENRKIWSIIIRLKKQGKIKSEGKGVYIKA